MKLVQIRDLWINLSQVTVARLEPDMSLSIYFNDGTNEPMKISGEDAEILLHFLDGLTLVEDKITETG